MTKNKVQLPQTKDQALLTLLEKKIKSITRTWYLIFAVYIGILILFIVSAVFGFNLDEKVNSINNYLATSGITFSGGAISVNTFYKKAKELIEQSNVPTQLTDVPDNLRELKLLGVDDNQWEEVYKKYYTAVTLFREKDWAGGQQALKDARDALQNL